MQTLKKNDELILNIESLGANGEGVAHFNGAVIFVPFALQGEEVLAHIILDKKNFYIAKIVSILKASPERVAAPCPYFSKCGGCDLQHLKQQSQTEFKTNLVKSTLKKYANIDHEVLGALSFGEPLGYRNKFAFPVAEKNGKTVIGMYRKNSHDIIEIEECLLQSKLAKDVLKIFKEYLEENKICGFNETTKTGGIKHIVFRESDGKFILTVVVAEKKFNNFEPLIQKLKSQNYEFGLYKNINLMGNNVIFGEKDEHIYGLKELELNEFGIKYYVNNRSFMQINDSVKSKIYEKITHEINETDIVIDAYSGAGLLSGIVAKKASEVYGIEIVAEATKNAEYLKEINGLKNLTNINGDCAIELPKLANKLCKKFTVILDPPRKGVDEKVVSAILETKPDKVIYLSCNPATLARDLKFLVEGYSIKFVQPYDMFPQTANVETLVSLVLKEENNGKWNCKK